MKHIKIRNKRIFSFKSKEAFLDFVEDKKKILIALNAEKLNSDNSELEKIINENIGYPDGIGAVIAMKKKGLKSVKIAGAEFWINIIKRYSKSKSFYLIGASEEVLQMTIKRLRYDFPDIRLVGYRNGFLKEGDDVFLIEEFKKNTPDIIFVAMGSPKQEFLMDFFLKQYPALYMGLGGSFDVYSGLKKRAPKLFIDLGLEWLYRFFKEPTRLKRQTNLVKFAFKIIFNKL